jgi:hypothetical protein
MAGRGSFSFSSLPSILLSRFRTLDEPDLIVKKGTRLPQSLPPTEGFRASALNKEQPTGKLSTGTPRAASVSKGSTVRDTHRSPLRPMLRFLSAPPACGTARPLRTASAPDDLSAAAPGTSGSALRGRRVPGTDAPRQHLAVLEQRRLRGSVAVTVLSPSDRRVLLIHTLMSYSLRLSIPVPAKNARPALARFRSLSTRSPSTASAVTCTSAPRKLGDSSGARTSRSRAFRSRSFR